MLQASIPKTETKVEALCAWLRNFCRDRVDFDVADDRRSLPPHVFTEFGRHGLFGLEAPESEGGLALKPSEALKVIECAASIDLSMASMLVIHNFLALRPLILCGSTQMRSELISETARGQRLASFAVTEKLAGSDPRRIQTLAVRTEQGWVLNGEKIWIGLSAWSGLIVTLANVEDRDGTKLGTVAFCFPTETQGVKQGPESRTMGLKGVVQNALHFENVFLTDQHILHSLTSGRNVVYSSMRFTRIAISSYCHGILRSVLASALQYASTREVAGGLLITLPFINAQLSEVVRHAKLMEDFLEFVYPLVDANTETDEILSLSAKIVSPELLWQDIDSCLQIMGGRGYIEENRVARMMRDARVIRIFEGPTETLTHHLGKMVFITADKFYIKLRDIIGLSMTLKLRAAFEEIFPEAKTKSSYRHLTCVAGQSMAYGIFVICAAHSRASELDPFEDFRREAKHLRERYENISTQALEVNALLTFLQNDLKAYLPQGEYKI